MLKDVPRISVLMGIYNCASTLEESIESLLNQTYKDFELILCDDGSIDATYSIALKYAEQYPQIFLLQNECNRGLNYTLNRCLAYARGEYIARQDGDDLSLADRFEKELAVFDAYPEVTIVSSAMIYFDEGGDFKTGRVVRHPQPRDFVRGTPFCHAPCMVKKEAILAVGGYSDSKWLQRVEDYHLWFKLYAQGYRGYNIATPLYKMRDDSKAIKRRKFKYRINEAYVRLIGYRMLHLPFYCYISVFKPLLVGVMPQRIYRILHQH